MAAGLTPLAVETQLWALTGEPLLGDAAVMSGLLVTGLLERTAEVSRTARKLEVAAQRYEAAEQAVTGSFSAEQLEAPWPGAGVAFLRDMADTIENFEVAFTRAGIDSPESFRDRVHLTLFGVLVRGGGPRGTDAVIRGPGVDDLLDGVLQLPWPDGAAAGPAARWRAERPRGRPARLRDPRRRPRGAVRRLASSCGTSWWSGSPQLGPG